MHARLPTSSKPYWWEDTLADADAAATFAADLPDHVDVVVVGAGLTGVETARVLAEQGRSVLVLDAGIAGGGASTRNAGMIGCNFKHRYGDLRHRVGVDAAKACFQELRLAYQAVADLATTDGARIGWQPCGRIVGAMTEAALARLHTEYRLRADELGEEVTFLDRRAMAAEIEQPLYLGGVRIKDNASLHPGKYYQTLLARARSVGAQVHSHCPVRRIVRERAGFLVALDQHRIRCGDVAMATNGYPHGASPWFARRLLPIDSYMLATNPLPDALRQRLWPHRRTYHCTRRRSHFLTLAADGQRLIFGGRTGGTPAHLPAHVQNLYEDLIFLFPALRDVGISHAWTGRCAATWDVFPRVGINPDGIHYAMGYCFSGNAMAPHLARKMAAAILGRTGQAASVFRTAHVPKVPWLARSPWAMPLAMRAYAYADRPAGLARRI